ncbi:MAG: TRAP transporter fused permease subunit, partial [Spirochaetia bacterium]|nr:TRAP transporter fused permease subunit [Spirochaetia bacterium]
MGCREGRRATAPRRREVLPGKRLPEIKNRKRGLAGGGLPSRQCQLSQALGGDVKNITVRNVTIACVAVVFLGFQGYMAFFRPLPPLLQNPIHLSLALMAAFLFYPLYRKPEGAAKSIKEFLGVLDFAAVIALGAVIVYFVTQADRLMLRIQYLDPLTALDYAMMAIVLVLLFESVRRVLGLNLLIFIFVFIAYAWFGKYAPAIISHRGTNWKAFTDLMIMGADGVFGVPLNASASFLYYFVIFGAFFAAGGGGRVLVDLGMKLSSKNSSGPAKAAILSSALFGMVNGSAVANVTTTGVMTIPMMKEIGYRPEQAGAVEAVASTGGQIMPPIMGVGAFIMAEMIGIPYVNIAISAIIPACVYFLAIFLLVDFIARKGSFRKPCASGPAVEPILPRLYLLLPVIALLVVIGMGRSLMMSAVYAIFAFLVINLIRGKKGLTPINLFKTLLQGTKQVAEIAVPTAACGIIIGIVVMSGLATKLSLIISALGTQSILPALLVTMLGCMVLGMALPTVAAYLAAYILFIPTLGRLGIPALPANMFIFYFGIVAQITPPVCLASFAAAGIAGANTWKTGWTAFRYAMPAFLVPFVFVEKPELLLMGTP